MTESIWDSKIAKAIGVIAATVTIIGFIVGILQYFGTIDLGASLSSFFELTVPMSYFILVSLLFLGSFLIFAMFPDYFYSKPMEGAELLRYCCVRYVAKLCRTPQTPAFVKEKYAKYCERHNSAKFTNSQSCLQAMEEKGLVQYDTEKEYWVTTKKSLDYLKKYYGYQLKRTVQ